MVLAAYLEAVYLPLEVLVQMRIGEDIEFTTHRASCFTTREKVLATSVAAMMTAVCQVRLCEWIKTDGTEVVRYWLAKKLDILLHSVRLCYSLLAWNLTLSSFSTNQ